MKAARQIPHACPVCDRIRRWPDIRPDQYVCSSHRDKQGNLMAIYLIPTCDAYRGTA
jgi:hypothetical protein